MRHKAAFVMGVVIYLCFSSQIAFASSEASFTNDMRNGVSLIDGESFSEYNSYGYVSGVTDALVLVKVIAKQDRESPIKTMELLKQYYDDNPEKIRQTIVDTLIQIYGG